MYYKLGADGRTPEPVEDVRETMLGSDYAEKRRVARDKIGDVLVSTVFLCLNHAYGDGPPILFETMIFGGEHDQYQDRYSTWEEAERGHKKAIAIVKGEIDPD